MRLRDNIIDSRLVGRMIRIHTLCGKVIEGILDEVTRYELGIRTSTSAVVVMRHSIVKVAVSESDIHGSGSVEADTVITSDFIGENVTILLNSCEEIRGRLMKLSKYEIGVITGEETYIVPKSAIVYVVLAEFEEE